MKKSIYFLLGLLVLGGIQACQEDDSYHVPDDIKVQNFVWKGLNLYYLWQTDEPDLADDRFANQDELNTFLRQYPVPENLFEHLLVDRSIDRFSVIFSDYRELEGILSGTTENNGVDFSLRYKPGSTTEIFGWVRYILPNSNASTQDIQRGDLFTTVNGTQLTVDNYQQLLANTSYTLGLADYDGGNITANGQSVSLTKGVLSENPVYIHQTYDYPGHKIGYLMYNGFYPDYDNQLNAAFAGFQSAGISDLVLDLRYNSGGSVQTATYLASMITGQFTDQVFAKEQWNAKLMDYFNQNGSEDIINRFTTSIDNGPAINSLNLSKIYIITSGSTASASELIINGLAPYINVVQIGDDTVGKNVGSVTLYDSENFQKEGADPSHYYAMQPIVLKIVNKDGFGDYTNGLDPDIDQVEDISNLGILGDTLEPLLSTAINTITVSGRRAVVEPEIIFRKFSDSKSMDGLRDQMYSNKIPPMHRKF
ncbi:S41 family peptidase [Flavobacterium silvaticum]|uniref:Peptidase S41 n=1 Tax=Flavobacterium silvaticum TaxID=1852020 RepID=A0A972FM22_9FLAO|nr:S41 family peptidase [Flavobacterium silvaticum]NMH28142.1 peptidase S41 [Flavobacterium silvaticum]